jgi:hypothetical protein
MPTKKPRLMLSVDPELLYDLETLALASRKPVATVATELLHDIRPRMLDIAREISAITMDRKRAHVIGDRLSHSGEGTQRGFTFSERVLVTGVELPASASPVSQAKSSGRRVVKAPAKRRTAK